MSSKSWDTMESSELGEPGPIEIEFKALVRVELAADEILRLLDRVGWPIIMNGSVERFRAALEAVKAVRK